MNALREVLDQARGVLNALGAQLDEIAARHGGRFDHWGPAMSTRVGTLADRAQLDAADLCNAGLHGDAIPLLREIVSLPVPIGQQSWRFLGMALAKTKQHEEALTALERALKVDPSDQESRVNLGLLFHELGRSEEAAEAWAHVLTRDPEHAKAHYNLACVLAGRGDRDGALSHLRAALAKETTLRILAQKDPDFASLQDDGDFRLLMETSDTA